jgi:hypothetical protein
MRRAIVKAERSWPCWCANSRPVVRNQAAVAASRLKSPAAAEAMVRLTERGLASPEIIFASIDLGDDTHARSLIPLAVG